MNKLDEILEKYCEYPADRANAKAAITAAVLRAIGPDEPWGPMGLDYPNPNGYTTDELDARRVARNDLRAQLRATIKGQHPQENGDE